MSLPSRDGERRGAAEGGGIHHCPCQSSHDGCTYLCLSAGYLDAVTAREISDGEPRHLLASPPSSSNQYYSYLLSTLQGISPWKFEERGEREINFHPLSVFSITMPAMDHLSVSLAHYNICVAAER